MSRPYYLGFPVVVVLFLSACDQLPLGFRAATLPSSDTGMEFASRSGQSHLVSEIIWTHLFSAASVNPPGFLTTVFGVSEEQARLIEDFAIEAKSRMMDFQNAQTADYCAKAASITTRSEAALANVQMHYNVELFEKTLVLELLDMLGDDVALGIIQTVHQSRSSGKNVVVSSIPADIALMELIRDRKPEELVAHYCDWSARVEASAGNQ